MRQSFLPTSKLLENPYSVVLGYPKATNRQLKSRFEELKKLGISGVSFSGDTLIGKLNILGKGYVGIVVLAKKKSNNTKLLALKIRRTDSQRKRMKDEATLLKIANEVRVGPRFIDSSKNFIVMEFVEGEKIFDWIKKQRGKGTASKLKIVLRNILQDCYNLDGRGIDHGELSNITKHAIVGKSKITILDFESASTKRRVSNVTSATQAIFIGSGIAKFVGKIYKIPPKEKIIDSLRRYKTQQTHQSFLGVLNTLKL